MTSLKFSLLFLFCLFGTLACQKENLENTLPQIGFQQVTAQHSGVNFTNTIVENQENNMIHFLYIYNGGGVVTADFNSDGLIDIFFTGNQVSSEMYLNKGNLQFQKVTEWAGLKTNGWATGATAVDINADGLLDIYVCRSGAVPQEERTNLLFINKGNSNLGIPKFSEEAAKYQLDNSDYSTQSAFFDYDKDGDLDMFLLNHTNQDRYPNRIKGEKQRHTLGVDKLYRNDGNVFTEVSQEAGIRYGGMGLGVGISDCNGDGWEDIYVSNDFIAHDYLYINQKDGTFVEKAKDYLKHHSHFSMGNDLADIDNDGWVDIVVLDMLPKDHYHRKKMAGPLHFQQYDMMIAAGYHQQSMRNTVQWHRGLNPNGEPYFSEIGQWAGVEATDWSWAPLLADFDNDGYRDLFITNGYRRLITDLDFIVDNAHLHQKFPNEKVDSVIIARSLQLKGIKRTNYLYKNKGNRTFQDVSHEWNIANPPSYSNGAAYADLDNDGDLDVVVNNINDTAFIFENKNAKYHFLKLHLKGMPKNRFGIGSRIQVFSKNKTQTYEHHVSRGFQSSVSHTIHFGLGQAAFVDSLQITWSDGKAQSMVGIPIDTTLVIDYQNATIKDSVSMPKSAPRIFDEVSKDYGINYLHKELPFSDFNYQPLLPHKHSQQGPRLSVADVNNDGLEDFFIGGSYNQPASIFLQKQNGTFQQQKLTYLPHEYEDIGSIFFDADNDGDMDLYVTSGSNEFAPNSPYYQDRLYLNDGLGNFSHASEALPQHLKSSSCVAAADWDSDGDMDLFVGGRLQVLDYPLPGYSYILKNEKGKFLDVTKEVAPSAHRMGMVTDAVWTDFDNDKKIDLVVVGEFMPVMFFKNTGKQLVPIPTTDSLQVGWWNCITAGDFDKDGDMDYAVGNTGKNSLYRPNTREPISIYTKDLDNNKRLDPLMTHYLDGKEYLVHPRDEFLRQIPIAKKRFLSYESYAKASFSQVLSSEHLQGSYVVKASEWASGYIENLGKGVFSFRPFPANLQLAPIHALLTDDVNGDGNLDLLVGGNFYANAPNIGKYDAFYGAYLQGDGKGNFKEISQKNSGFFIEGECRDIVKLRRGDSTIFIVGRNEGELQVFGK